MLAANQGSEDEPGSTLSVIDAETRTPLLMPIPYAPPTEGDGHEHDEAPSSEHH